MAGGVDKATTVKDVFIVLQTQEARLQALEDKVKNLYTEVGSPSTDMASVKESLATIVLFCQQQGGNIVLLAASSVGASHSQDNELMFKSGKFSKHPKIYFPRFYGTNPRGWIRKCERYFQLNSVGDVHKVDLASIHFDGKADSWFLDYQEGKILIDWLQFSSDICCRFEDVAYDNYVSSFNKLSQLTTVEEYYERYESLKYLMKDRNPSLSDAYFTMSFISGLKEEIRNQVQMFKPNSDTDAFYLARMQQASVDFQNKRFRNFPKPFQPSPTTFSPIPSPSKTSLPQLTNIPKSSFSNTKPFEASSPSSVEELEEDTTAPSSPIESSMEISLHAVTGLVTQNTIRVTGILHSEDILVLIDTGSTHSFVDSQLAEKLQLPIIPTGHMLVTVANGDTTISKGLCSELVWSMQGYQFCGDLRVLPLGGCHMVLGVDWLKQLGDAMFNLADLKVSFLHQGKQITLQGTSSIPSCNLISGSSFMKFLKANTPTIIGQFFSISTMPLELIPPEINTLLDSFSDVFTKPTSLPPPRALDHKIPLKPNSTHISQRPYRCPYSKRSSGKVDYRKLNDITIKYKFPIPLTEELLDELDGAIIFTKIDLTSGYHQIRMDLSDIFKTAFRTHQGHYKFRVMPFGLTNVPATFQSLMNTIFKPYLRKFILVFLDDILVYSESVEEHVLHLSQTLSLLRAHSLFANKKKCCFAQLQLDYLGHLITSQGFAVDPDKIVAMQTWPQPVNLKQLRVFLGLTGYYRRFVKGYGVLSKPLTDMLKKYYFVWSPLALQAFSTLKQAMISAPVIDLPNFSQPFTLETDACSTGVGEVLMQNGRPIAFYSKALGPKALALSTYEKELLAIVVAVKNWRHHLSHSQFIIHTDHQSLKYLMEQRITTVLQHKCIMKLMGLDYVIKYKKGMENKAADALSRLPHDASTCQVMAVSQQQWHQDIIASYTEDSHAQQLISELLIPPTNKLYSFTDGILSFKSRLYVGSHMKIRQTIIHSVHTSVVGGNSGMMGTYNREKSYFYWPHMKEEIFTFFAVCVVFQCNKPDHSSLAGLLQPLPIPERA
ncbi:uncharacterized protein LOC113355284 [Papaver somniferum]|uniref:uncharacterized protein LOC113355284 n=1 Tax=Papaver somniferum TaxID=3469 RepID=UPI000E701D39|nr:uncharacterized protein LOC113355284 [Papaver somniferum]